MKKLALMASMAAATLGLSSLTGCGNPGYDTQDRFSRIGRNWGYEYQQIQQDVDHLLLLDPATHLTFWNVQ